MTFDGDVADACNGNVTHTGTISFVDGYFGQGVALNNGFVTLNDYAVGTDSFTVALWIKADTVTSDPCIFANKDWQTGRNQGYALEHTGYFDGTKFAKAMKKNDVRTDLKKKKKETAFSFCGMDELVTPTGKSCSKVHIDFGPCTSTLKYNEEQNVYIKYMNGNPHKDAKTKKKLKFTNVLILETTIYTRDQKGHKYVDWEGGKKAVGYYISNGKKQKITWSKKSEGSYLKFYDKNGDELVINRGKTYIAFVSPGMESFTE